MCVILPLLAALVLSLCVANVDAAIGLQPPVKLRWHYYRLNTSCRYAEAYVTYQVQKFYKQDNTIAAKLLRLLYSDCFVTVCLDLSFTSRHFNVKDDSVT